MKNVDKLIEVLKSGLIRSIEITVNLTVNEVKYLCSKYGLSIKFSEKRLKTKKEEGIYLNTNFYDTNNVATCMLTICVIKDGSNCEQRQIGDNTYTIAEYKEIAKLLCLEAEIYTVYNIDFDFKRKKITEKIWATTKENALNKFKTMYPDTTPISITE